MMTDFSRRTSAMALMAAFLGLRGGEVSRHITFGFFSGFAGYDAEATSNLLDWSHRAETAFEFVSFLLFAIALSHFLQEHQPDATPTI